MTSNKETILLNKKKYYNNTNFLLELKNSQIPNGGLGLFAKEKIKKGKLVAYYGGDLVKILDDNYDPDYSIEINKKYVIDGSKYPRPFTSMINDAHNSSFSQNCEFRIDLPNKRVEIRSIAIIEEGVELFVDYGEDYWKTRSDLQ